METEIAHRPPRQRVLIRWIPPHQGPPLREFRTGQSDPEGFKISINELDFLDIVVEKKEDIESETRRILSEMLELNEENFELQFKNF